MSKITFRYSRRGATMRILYVDRLCDDNRVLPMFTAMGNSEEDALANLTANLMNTIERNNEINAEIMEVLEIIQEGNF